MVLVPVRDQVHVQCRGDLFCGYRRWLDPALAIQVEIGGDELAARIDQPAQVAQPTERDTLFG